MDIKAKYYSLSKDDFDEYLESMKNSEGVIHFLENQKRSYFYVPSNITKNKILTLNIKQYGFDVLLNSFSEFGKRQIVQSFFLNEIESTNAIENLFSTRHDIFYAMNNINKVHDNKITSIINCYKLLLNNDCEEIKTLQDIRNTYDVLLKGCIGKNDLPDGKYFRKNLVGVSNGTEFVHMGIKGEENINKGMEEFLSLYKNKELNIYERIILGHFLIETIHPYYDGNGRLGRFLMSKAMFEETKSYFSFLIAKSFNNEKNLYYKAFKIARNLKEFGYLNNYVELMVELLLKEIDSETASLNKKKNDIDRLCIDKNMTKSEAKIIKLIAEATILSDYGVSNEEIMKYTNVSKRTLIYALNSFKEKGLLEDTQIGKITYHKLK